ncbi:hypothetical protein AMIS_23210 [Actinoplanes missouriensis 431]|uniref:Secreted protein n=1 Tax=Actinoplanes missouriensis (strain ATCC 14538 / DSM 43046 / CBS 188.64 / JCM 3121 / NBRC 102363 / NCIMB 12654 / NRRL B-3342 / UNCC 431) TaxID=512565 RepID=I0H3F4_ACTM4|nr:hypothetical protein [Actinoplanes missouriensis]BAL87541.1 hypothetical protein AMIS_23210 [Actinoplanes missouriensis 431]
MRLISKFLLAMLVGLAGVLAVTTPASASPPPPTQLGGLDIGAYCRSIGYADAALTGTTAYDWHCVAGGRQGDLAFDAACRWQYGNEHVVDRIDDFYDPTSVSCWAVQPDVVTPDFEKYCTGKGYSGSALLGTTVYDWHCVRYGRAGPTYYDIDVPAACAELTHGYARLDRFANFYDATTWQCRV